MGSIGGWELVIILAIILIIFGPGKLPQVGSQLGKAIRSFRDAKEDIKEIEDPKDKEASKANIEAEEEKPAKD